MFPALKRFACALAALALALPMAGCGRQKELSPLVPLEEQVILTMATSHNENHIASQSCRRFAQLVKERSNGRISIQICYDGEFGDDQSTLEQCQYGGLDLTLVSASSAAEFAPLMYALQMPYQYTGADHLFRVWDGAIGQEVFNTFEDNRLVCLTYLYSGSNCFFNSAHEVHTSRDLRGLRFASGESQYVAALMDRVGAVGAPIQQSDLYQSIQTGIVHGGENNIMSYVELRLYEVAPYWTNDVHSFIPDMLIASKSAYRSLSPEDRELLQACAQKAQENHRNRWEVEESKNLKLARENGCIITNLSGNEIKTFRIAAQPMYDLLDEDQLEIVERVRKTG